MSNLYTSCKETSTKCYGPTCQKQSEEIPYVQTHRMLLSFFVRTGNYLDHIVHSCCVKLVNALLLICVGNIFVSPLKACKDNVCLTLFIEYMWVWLLGCQELISVLHHVQDQGLHMLTKVRLGIKSLNMQIQATKIRFTTKFSK